MKTGSSGDRAGSLDVSVVIATRNQADLVRDAIQACMDQTMAPERYEIIVVDNCSTDHTKEVVEALAQSAQCSVIYHCMDVNKGPANSRNHGVTIARGKLIAFTDSDCRPQSEWLALGVAAFDDEKVGLVSGPVVYPPGQKVTFFSRASGEAFEEHPSYPTANAFYRRSAFMEAGGFDVALCFSDFRNRPVECADTDLAWRVKEAGHKNVFIAEAVVHHLVAVIKPLNWVLEPYRLFVVPALVRRHPQLRQVLLVWRFFFTEQNVSLYLAGVGLVCVPLVHWATAALALPFFLWAARAGNPSLTILDLPKMVARSLFIAARQAAMCAGLLYGSLRFRTLVL